MTTTAPVASGVRQPRMARDVAARLAPVEYDRLLQDLRHVDAEDWRRPTDCPAWTVRDMAGHVVGMARMAATLRESLRQDRIARKAGGSYIDALTALQVREQADLDTASLLDRFADVGPRAAKARARTPRLLRRMPMGVPQVVGDHLERWSNAYLLDVILTRDTWMHRMDIARATGHAPQLTADHDGRIVADVVDEWAERHRRPYRLELTGPAGGVFARDNAPALVIDAVDFCRVLSGRRPTTPVEHELLETAVPF
ncbi:MAG: hypothetical protein K0Q93_3143 [Nocardioidaceae bacterium]|nr:hypothetical protein [Nocardioidaceae bacterium]